MRRITLSLLLALVSVLALSSCQEPRLTTKEVLNLLDSLEAKFEWLDYRLTEETWELYTAGHSDSLEFYRGLYNYVISDQKTFKQLQNGKHLLTDEVDKRRWELVYTTFLLSQVETQRPISRLRDSLAAVDINYRAEFEGEQRTAEFLYKTYRTDSNRGRRKDAYRAWCSIGLELADGLERLFRLRNQQARKLGYNNFLAMTFSLQEIDNDYYLSLLRRLDSLSEEPYQQILDKTKRKLRQQEIEICDFAYAYADINEEVDRYFPADSQMPYLKRSLKELGFNLDKLPIYFDLEPRGGKSQFAYAFTIKPPYDMRVLANLSDGLYSTWVLLHEIGHALHSTYIDQDRTLFASALSGGWSEGMAQTVAALCDERQWLEEYAHMPTGLIDRYLTSKREQDVIYLRTTLLRLYFEYEAYTNPDRDLNKLYWDLFEKYLMLPRHDEIKPWAAIIHYITHPVYLQNYLIADMIAAQTLDFLKESYGAVVDNPIVGSFLIQNYFRFGARYDWRELLERGTGEKLNPKYLMDRFGI